MERSGELNIDPEQERIRLIGYFRDNPDNLNVFPIPAHAGLPVFDALPEIIDAVAPLLPVNVQLLTEDQPDERTKIMIQELQDKVAVMPGTKLTIVTYEGVFEVANLPTAPKIEEVIIEPLSYSDN